MSQSDRPLDIIVWGATGFTGQIVATYLAKNAPSSVKWTIAGRSKSKLEAIRATILDYNPAFQQELVIADSADLESLRAMCKQTRVIISTVGPYNIYGKPLIQACVESQTDYVDITGEFDFVRANHKEYHETCKENGTMIVSCCGFDCLPSDLGVYLLVQEAQQKYQRHVTNVKGCIYKMRGVVSGGTVATMMHGAQQPMKVMQKQKAEADANGTPIVKVHYDEDFKGAQGFMPLSVGNEAIVRLSSKINHDEYGPTFKYQETQRYANIVVAWLVTIGYLLFLGALKLSVFRWLAGKFLPAPGEGPSVEEQLRGLLEMRFIATLEQKDGDTTPIQLKSRYRINLDPGYAGTALMLSTVALTIVQRRDELPGKAGGVLTPATAFGDVVVDELRKAGVVLRLEDWQ
jgi:short subunit dehydrogenase-like uncharacterized protein